MDIVIMCFIWFPFSFVGCYGYCTLSKLCLRKDKVTLEFRVVSFVEDHNHALCPSNYVPLIYSFHGMSAANKAQVDSMHVQGIGTYHIMNYMMNQDEGHQSLQFNKNICSTALNMWNHFLPIDLQVMVEIC
ncbi:hypothetical protein VNO78_34510 [Psophocarpus tetragonolobus]|uniref:Protein FAR1-RELATED SEQUENCE n=1 Tax=Psophocarpus tetragonolobus TaxID=3891 RepID=A0AAN9NT76_PSOTE